MELLLLQIVSLWKIRRKVTFSEHLLYARYCTRPLAYTTEIVKGVDCGVTLPGLTSRLNHPLPLPSK